MNDDTPKAPTKTDKRAIAIKKAWTDFSRSIGQIKGRMTTLKMTQDDKEREAKLTSIKQAINEHR